MSTVDRYPIEVEPCGKGEDVVLECMPDHGYPRGQIWQENGTTCPQFAANYGVPLVSGRAVGIAVKQLMGDKRRVVCGSGRLGSRIEDNVFALPRLPDHNIVANGGEADVAVAGVRALDVERAGVEGILDAVSVRVPHGRFSAEPAGGHLHVRAHGVWAGFAQSQRDVNADGFVDVIGEIRRRRSGVKYRRRCR